MNWQSVSLIFTHNEKKGVAVVSIYLLSDPLTGEIRYVGKTKTLLKVRLSAHLRQRGHNHKIHWLQNLQRSGLLPLMQLIQQVPVEGAAQAERYWISHFREIGCSLLNVTTGGEGIPGWRHTVLARAKIGAASKKRKHTVETREKIRQASKGRVQSIETRDRMSRAMKGHVVSDETREKLRVSSSNRAHSFETREKMRQARQRYLARFKG